MRRRKTRSSILEPQSCPGRRTFLAAAGKLTVAAFLPATAAAQLNRTQPNNMPEVIRRLAGGAQINPGKVKITLPPLVENGHLVPLTVSVESPMTATDYVKAIHVFTDKNPLPEVISFYLGPQAGRATFSTRVRLADSENAIAIAQMSDGSLWSDRVYVVVTTAACLEEL